MSMPSPPRHAVNAFEPYATPHLPLARRCLRTETSKPPPGAISLASTPQGDPTPQGEADPQPATTLFPTAAAAARFLLCSLPPAIAGDRTPARGDPRLSRGSALPSMPRAAPPRPPARLALSLPLRAPTHALLTPSPCRPIRVAAFAMRPPTQCRCLLRAPSRSAFALPPRSLPPDPELSPAPAGPVRHCARPLPLCAVDDLAPFRPSHVAS